MYLKYIELEQSTNVWRLGVSKGLAIAVLIVFRALTFPAMANRCRSLTRFSFVEVEVEGSRWLTVTLADMMQPEQ